MSETWDTGATSPANLSRLEDFLPSKAAYYAHWIPVFLEPVSHSGERLCIGIAAKAECGEIGTALAVHEDALRAAFGTNGDKLLAIARLALNDLKDFLEKGGWLTHWQPPLGGISLGGPRESASRDKMAGILRQGMMLSACFSTLLLDPREESAEERKQAEEDRWPRQVRAALQTSAPQLAQFFGKEFSIARGARRTPIDFIGHKLAAGLGKLIPTGQSLSGNIKEAKVKLWNLDSLRAHQGELFLLAHYELLLYRPEDTNPEYSDRQIARLHEAILELTAEADRHEIRVLHFTAAHQAAARIIQQEAA